MQEILEIANKIKQKGGTLYLVGGAVRDILLNRVVKEEDYCVTGISKVEFEELFPQARLRGKSFPVYELEGREFALARTETKSGIGHKEFEIYTGKEITIEQDLARRDITINAIAQNILTNEIIDPFKGREDIKKRMIRKVGESFKEDPLRVYRVARFAATLEFEVEPETIQEMKKLKQELGTLSKERIEVEFRKALQSNKPARFFETLRKAELLQIHFKEIGDLIGKIQPEQYHPEGDSYQHTMIALDATTSLTDKLEIRFSCLVHDLGKGTTPMEILPHHYGHEERGEKLVSVLGNRIGVPKKWIKCGKIAAKEHMKAGRFEQLTPKKQVDLIEKLSKSELGLEGMKIVVMCDKYRNGVYPQNIEFDQIGKECLAQITGKKIKEKYQLEEGKRIKEKLHEERINWIKKYKE